MAIAKNPPSTAAFANRLITRLVIQHAPPTLPSSSFRFTLSSRPSAFRDATSADPLLLAFQPHRPTAFGRHPEQRSDEGSLFDSASCPGANRASRTRLFLFSARRQNRLQRRNRPINLLRLRPPITLPQNRAHN